MRHRPLLESEAGRAALDGLCEPERLSPEIAIQLVAAVQSQIERGTRRAAWVPRCGVPSVTIVWMRASPPRRCA